MLEKIKHWWFALPDKKKYIEFITALLTVPVLLTVLLSNINSLKNSQKAAASPAPAPTPVAPQVTIIQKENPTPVASPTASPTPAPTPTPATCNSAVGPVDIANPDENEIVSANPVNIIITYNQGNFCAVVWSYRINGGTWSDFTNNSISIYNLSPGTQNLDVQVKSVVSGSVVVLHRTFTVSGPTPTQSVSTSSASLQ
jgi:hypothetical protein